ncbi:MAG: putative dsRNA-binding protein [Pseudomonadota bacterium]
MYSSLGISSRSQALALPVYSVLEELGPDHARLFTVQCEVSLLAQPVVARAGSRRKAEQAAAAVVLEQLQTETLNAE